ncbi:MAG TPA: pyruvate dehydrogenase (acetyl-transferring) E1 component subunit alpha [Pyrinomonadaceae bacterium]|jgi:pyruvate dehydrogenase E1 component alpha subunit|nr:pyruvate dehydrogenase (acetyl-transferring) E1 component subunit alpha [Pyrinomonadaceae bacterium]
MSKQTAAPPSAAKAEEQQSSTGVMDAPPDVDSKKLKQERDEAKERQKDRLKGLSREQLIELYRQMLLIRRFEEKSAEAYVAGKIGGFCHLYIGQEAVGVGTISAIRKDDYVLASYREHGLALAKGMTSRSIMAELFGKATGCSKGKGGSMHMFDKELGFLGGHAIVGGQIPLATGTAFATKYQGTDRVTLCYFGEAAVNQGAFHESLNMAQLWKLPCIYICENNQYGMGTSLARAMSLSDISKKACAYDLASEFVDGMDVLAVREATLRAVERARKDYLPTLLEIRTYRFMGHSMSDPGNYRTRAEIEKYQERDPIKLYSATLLEEKVVDEKTLEEIDRKVREEVEDALRFADESPLPDPKELYTDVYANPIEPGRK